MLNKDSTTEPHSQPTRVHLNGESHCSGQECKRLERRCRSKVGQRCSKNTILQNVLHTRYFQKNNLKAPGVKPKHTGMAKALGSPTVKEWAFFCLAKHFPELGVCTVGTAGRSHGALQLDKLQVVFESLPPILHGEAVGGGSQPWKPGHLTGQWYYHFH